MKLEKRIKKRLKVIKQATRRLLGRLWRVLTPVRRVLRRLWRPVGRFFATTYRRAGAWYDQQAQHYPIMRRLWFRLTLIAIAIAIVFSPIYGLVSYYLRDQTYKMTAAETKLLGKSSVGASFIKQTDSAITYNRADEQSPQDVQKVLQLAASKMDATGKKPYQAELPKKSGEPIVFSDSSGSNTVRMTPQFATTEAKLQDSRVVYPAGSATRHIYTFKSNGIKSDIVLREAPSEQSHTYSWRLKLDSTLEARMNPDGSIGVYTGGSDLLSNVQASDAKTQQLIDKGRSSGPKNNLVYELPRPYVLDAHDKTNYDDVYYKLSGDTLNLVINNLTTRAYPLSIDPTIIVTTTADFQQKTGDTGNMQTNVADQISRAPAASGGVGTATENATGIYSPFGGMQILGDFNGTFPGTGWTTGGDQNWIADSLVGQEGSATAQTGDITDSQATWIDYNYTAPMDGNLVFQWAVSSEEGYDYLSFCLDNDSCTGASGSSLQISGSVDWQVATVPVTAGAHSFRWLYDKDGSGLGGSDTGLLDYVRFTPPNDDRYGHTSVAYNGYLYIIGGSHTRNDTSCNSSSSNYCSDIQYCPINANGSVGSCTQQTNAFTTARSEHTSVVYNGYLYIIGGTDGSNPLNDIQYCPINANGTVGSCTQQTNAFTTARSEHTSVVYNGYLYIIGGIGSIELNDIQYCPINANGTVGSCTQQTNAFTTARLAQTSVVYNGYLYIIGGTDGTNQNDIQYCPINANGSVGSCTQQTNAFTTARSGHTSVAYNGYLYIIGGTNGSYQNDIQYCPINANGSVGSCTQQTSTFTTARSQHTSVVYNGYLYIIGGIAQNGIQYARIDSVLPRPQSQTTNLSSMNVHSSVVYNGYHYVIGGAGVANIDRCPINTNGSVGACTEQTNAYTTARLGHTSVVYNGYLYIIGGATPAQVAQNDIQYCPINANGSVGSCTRQTNAFTTTRLLHTSVVYNGYLYIIGGSNGSYSIYYNDIQYCPLNANGSVGACTQQTNAFTTARYGHTSVVYNGYLYVIGGTNGSYQNDIQYCPINANGSVGSCTQQTSAFTTARSQHTSVVYNGYLYIIGGWGSNQNDIQYCPLNANGSIGACIQQTNAYDGGTRMGFTSVVYNGYLYIIAGWVNGLGYVTDIQYLQLGAGNGGLAAEQRQTAMLPTARDSHTTVADNGYLYVIGGYNGTTNYNTIHSCAISPTDGSVGSCNVQATPEATFTTGRRSHASVVYNGYIYIIGGYDGANYLNDISYCAIGAGGTIPGGCTQQTNAFYGARNNFEARVYNGKLYIMGGYDGNYFDDIQYCPINAGGSIGTCTQQLHAFYGARDNFSTEINNGYLYIIGGFMGNTDYETDIQYCPITAAGWLGKCTRQNDAFDIGRRSHTTVMENGYLYIIGGYNNNFSTAYFNLIQYCPINTNGSVGICETDMNAFTNVRSSHSSFVENGYLYIIGGSNTGGVYYDDIIRIAITKTMPQKARYERTFDTGSSGNTVNSFVIDGTVPTGCSYTVLYRTAGSSGVYGAATTLTGVMPGASQTITAATQRYVFMAVSLDDTECGGQSTITSIALTYNGAPDVPTLVSPANGATGIDILPELRLGSTDDSNDYLRYTIQVCSTSDCVSVVRTIDQSVSQVGWLSQGMQSGTAYSGGLPLTQQAIHRYQTAALTAGTQYWWRAKAIDPGGTNQSSAYSSIYSFTTGSATPSKIIVNQNTRIYSGSRLKTGP